MRWLVGIALALLLSGCICCRNPLDGIEEGIKRLSDEEAEDSSTRIDGEFDPKKKTVSARAAYVRQMKKRTIRMRDGRTFRQSRRSHTRS